MNDPINTICDLKWNYPIFNLQRGEFRSCCRTPSKVISEQELADKGTEAFLNSTHMKQSRLDLIKGIRHDDCVSCWKLEDSGMKSPRHGPELAWEYLNKINRAETVLPYTDDRLKTLLSKIEDIGDPILASYHPYMLEVSLGNTCDMKCMYCSHHYSTQWGTEKIKWREITQEQYDFEFPEAAPSFNDKYWQWFDSVKMRIGRLGIIGGEPLITPEFYTFVDRLIASMEPVKHLRKKKMTFWIVTNMNTPPNYLEKFFNYLPKITEIFDVEILVSMESIEDKAEYIRNGISWKRFTSNLDKLLSKQDLQFEFGFILSLNVLNIPSLLEFIVWVKDLYKKYNKPIALKHNIISFPDWQSPLILTPDFADYIDNCISYMKSITDMPVVDDVYGRWNEYIVFLENLATSIRENTADNSEQRRKFAEWFDTYDSRRNLNLLQTFPEHSEFYNMCKKL
jgi:hypothetical protein